MKAIITILIIISIVFLGYHFIDYLKVTRGTDGFAKRRVIYYLFAGFIILSSISSLLADTICKFLQVESCQSFQYLSFAAYIVLAISSVLIFKTNSNNDTINQSHLGQGDNIQGGKIVINHQPAKHYSELETKELIAVSKFFQTLLTEVDYLRYFDIYRMMELNGLRVHHTYKTIFFGSKDKSPIFDKNGKIIEEVYGYIEYCKRGEYNIIKRENWGIFKNCNFTTTKKYQEAINILSEFENSVLLEKDTLIYIKLFKIALRNLISTANKNINEYARNQLPNIMKEDKKISFDNNVAIGSIAPYERIKSLVPEGKNVLNHIKEKLKSSSA